MSVPQDTRIGHMSFEELSMVVLTIIFELHYRKAYFVFKKADYFNDPPISPGYALVITYVRHSIRIDILASLRSCVY